MVKLKSCYNDFRAKLLSAMTMLLMNQPKSKADRALIAGSVAFGALTGSSASCYAAGDLEATARNGLQDLFKIVLVIGNGALLVMLAFRWVQYGLADNMQKKEMRKDNMKAIIIALVGMNCVGIVASFIVKATSGNNNGMGQTTDSI